MTSELQKQKYIITLLGYTNPNHTNWYPWKIFNRVFRELGYSSEWLESDAVDLSSSRRRLFICWNEPDAKTLVRLGKVRPGDIILQKLTSLGKGCEHIKWGNDALHFFRNWTWPIYKSVEDLYDSGVNIYAFGCKTSTELFPEKHRICEKLKDRIFWIPWGSSLYTWEEIQNAKPVTDGFIYDIGFVGSIWGTVGRGNIEGIRDYLSPLLPGRKFMLAGRGTQKGPVDDGEHKEILRRSRLCPIINAASWRAEKGIQDRFWTVFTTGRFGVADTEGVYDFFDEKDVVCEPNPGEYVEKSLYFLENTEKQIPYIEKIQAKIKSEYNYYVTWENIFNKILYNENKISGGLRPTDSCTQNQAVHDRIISPPKSPQMHGHQLIIALQNEILNLTKNRRDLAAIEIGSERGSGSTLKLSRLFKSLGLKFLTVDADKDIAADAERIVKSVDSNFEAHHQLGEVFLSNYPSSNIAVVYLDAFDIVTDWPHKQETIESYRKRGVALTNELSWKMHLDASQAIYDKVINGGLICIDDVWKDENGQWQGKGKTAVPFLLNNGYSIVMSVPNCAILKRTTEVSATAIGTKIASPQSDSNQNIVFSEQPKTFLFVPSNDTHVHWMYPLAKAMGKSRFMVISEKNERADFYLENLGEKFLAYMSGILGQIKPNVIVFGCDWGGYEQQMIREAKTLGIPTVCIQEGCLDFMDQRVNRMLHADYAFLQGPVMRKYIRRENNVFVTGNPKYDSLFETPLPDKVMVMINSNFTYGIFEQARDKWVSDVAEACKSLGLYFFISQHPRDKGVFPGDYRVIKSEAFKLSRQLEKTSILVSRFSTVIYEAAAMGREVVYYNPHHEPFRIFAQDTTDGIQIANNRTELTKAIQSAVLNLGTNYENRRKFIQQHCDTLNHDAVTKCSEHLQAIVQKHFYTEQSKHDRLNLSGMHAEPLISVIMPAYNAAEYIATAIESVLNQNYKNFELLIINDGSTDGTEAIIHSFKDGRIRYFRQENRGLAATHNTGIRQSRGELIIKLDADDKMTPDFIARHLQQFEKHPEADLVYCDDLLIDQNDKQIRTIKRPEYANRKLLIRDMFRSGFPVVPFRTCIRRAVFDKIGFFDESLPIGEDYDMMRRFIKHGLKIRHLPSALYMRRMTENSLSRNLTPQKAKCQFELVKRFTETFRHDELFPDIEWYEIPADKINLHAKCLAVVTYLAIGQDYLNAHSAGFYADYAFENACSELQDCLKIDPGNRQIRQLLQKCQLGKQKYEKHSKQAVC